MSYTPQKMKFSINDFFSKCDQICSFLRIWSYFLKKSLMENFIFFAVIAERIHSQHLFLELCEKIVWFKLASASKFYYSK